MYERRRRSINYSTLFKLNALNNKISFIKNLIIYSIIIIKEGCYIILFEYRNLISVSRDGSYRSLTVVSKSIHDFWIVRDNRLKISELTAVRF